MSFCKNSIAASTRTALHFAASLLIAALVVIPAAQGEDFGAASTTVRKIEELLDQSKSSLGNSDYLEYLARFAELKKSVSLELSRGADASAIIEPLKILELEIRNRVGDTGQQHASRKTQLEERINACQTALKLKADELSKDEWSAFLDRLTELKTRSAKEPISDEEIGRLKNLAQDLDFEISGKAMFHSQRGSLTYTRERDEPAAEKVKAEDRAVETASESKKTAGEQKPQNMIRAPKKPPLPIPKIMEQIENQLIEFHEKHQIGSFDMDSFTERLLAQKRNLHVMMSKTGRISARQEVVVREELEHLQEELTNRVTGKN